MIISIHAPAKGATCSWFNPPSRCYISIHAPAKGATIVSVLFSLGICISIHAPAKGATFPARFPMQSSWVFQSTLPRRERPCSRQSCRWCWSFQSTLPRRERLDRHQRCRGLRISIHAPAKGATRVPSIQNGTLAISIHAPAKGATDCTFDRTA